MGYTITLKSNLYNFFEISVCRAYKCENVICKYRFVSTQFSEFLWICSCMIKFFLLNWLKSLLIGYFFGSIVYCIVQIYCISICRAKVALYKSEIRFISTSIILLNLKVKTKSFITWIGPILLHVKIFAVISRKIVNVKVYIKGI